MLRVIFFLLIFVARTFDNFYTRMSDFFCLFQGILSKQMMHIRLNILGTYFLKYVIHLTQFICLLVDEQEIRIETPQIACHRSIDHCLHTKLHWWQLNDYIIIIKNIDVIMSCGICTRRIIYYSFHKNGFEKYLICMTICTLMTFNRQNLPNYYFDRAYSTI